MFLVSHFADLRYPWPMRFERKNCLPFGYSNNQFERPLTFKSSHTCKFCFYAVVELRGGYTYYAFYWLQLPHISVLIFYGATCNVNWFTLLTAWSNNGVDNFARLLMLTPRSDWINLVSFVLLHKGRYCLSKRPPVVRDFSTRNKIFCPPSR